ASAPIRSPTPSSAPGGTPAPATSCSFPPAPPPLTCSGTTPTAAPNSATSSKTAHENAIKKPEEKAPGRDRAPHARSRLHRGAERQALERLRRGAAPPPGGGRGHLRLQCAQNAP